MHANADLDRDADAYSDGRSDPNRIGHHDSNRHRGRKRNAGGNSNCTAGADIDGNRDTPRQSDTHTKQYSFSDADVHRATVGNQHGDPDIEPATH